jgi:acid phosphatase type 7
VGTDQRFRAPATGNRIFWYAFASGAVTVVTLSSEHDLSPGSAQGAFLERTLSAVNRSLTPWVVVTAHREMYSLTGSEQAQQDGFRALLEPVFMRHGVDLVFNGHLHSSQRTCPTFNYTCQPAGTAPVYIISGSSGAMLEPSTLSDPNHLVQFYNDRSCGYYVVSVANATHARLQWSRNSDGAVLDDAWVVRGQAAAASSRSAPRQ